MSLEVEKQSQEAVRGLLNKDHKEELGKILVFGEKYKAEGKQMERDFWKKWSARGGDERRYHYLDDKQVFRWLIIQHEANKKFFLEGLSQEEKDIWDSLSEMAKEKFYKEYLFDRVVYDGDVEGGYKEEKIHLGEEVKPKWGKKVEDTRLEGLEKWIKSLKNILKPGVYLDLNEDLIGLEDMRIIAEGLKNGLQPGMTVDLGINRFGDRGIEVLAKERKDNLKLGMRVILQSLDMGLEGVKVLAKEWKNSLQPGMGIYLGDNKIGDKGVEILAKEWKNSLQPGMQIDLSKNNIGIEGIKVLAKEWKNSLQSGMCIGLSSNEIGDEGLKILAEEWKDSLKPGMTIYLKSIGAGDRGIDAIVSNLKLKDGVEMHLSDSDLTIDLQDNVSEKMKKKVKRWEETNNEEGVNCKVYVW